MAEEIEEAAPIGKEAEISPYEDPRYKIYLQENSSYAQEKLEIFKIVPTYYVSLSTFMFGGSLWALTAFQNPKFTRLLVVTWICLAGSLSMMLFELLFSLRAYERAGEISGERYRTNDYEKVHPNIWSTVCIRLQVVASVLFVLGIIAFLSFFSFNLSTPRSSDVGPKAQTSSGTAPQEKLPVSADRSPDSPARPLSKNDKRP